MAEHSQADYVNVPSGKKRSWATPAQKVLFLLVGLNMLGLVAERWLIYNLYGKMEVFSLHMSHCVCQNLSNPQESGQQGVTTISPAGPEVRFSSEIPTVQPYLNRPQQVQQRPFAQLIGSKNPAGENNVLQWIHRGGESVTYNMGYNNGQLLVNMDGYYYVYCKVIVNAAEDCLLIQHKLMKVALAYGKPIELMKSKSFHCPKNSSEMTTEVGEDLWNSFLAGIFELQSGDQIFATVEDKHKIRTGATENVMGAFMITP